MCVGRRRPPLGMGTRQGIQQLNGSAQPLPAGGRGHSPHLPGFTAPPIRTDTGGKPPIPASEPGDAGHKDKGMELLHGVPGLFLWLEPPLLLSAPGPACQEPPQRGPQRRRVRCLRAKSAEVPGSEPWRSASPSLALTGASLPTPSPWPGRFL
uniref:Uncharacterized protein n=1 Tax=Pipistrellus kuhlii TaxID=59472 RepID=A0A7J8B1K0_PIPKU|nr:hypothetical protein mPipKuh1_007833 [Pipistrellus kuhlii]